MKKQHIMVFKLPKLNPKVKTKHNLPKLIPQVKHLFHRYKTVIE